MDIQFPKKDLATRVYDCIDLLSIKRSVRMLLELDRDIIEDFVQKYSSIMIFLLNILDRNRSLELLEKLTDSSIIYIVEEELRLLIIREIALAAGDLDAVLELTEFLERMDLPEENLTEITASAGDTLARLIYSKNKRIKLNLAYMSVLSSERREEILRRILKRNIYVAFGMLPFASPGLINEIIDLFAFNLPGELAKIPPDVLLKRFETDHGELLKEEILRSFPEELRDILMELNSLREKFREDLEKIRRAGGEDMDNHETKQEILNTLFQILKSSDPRVHDLFLAEFLDRKILNEDQIYMLKLMARTE